MVVKFIMSWICKFLTFLEWHIIIMCIKKMNFISKLGVTSTSTMYLNVDIVQYKQICMGDVNNKEMIIKRISWHEWTKASIK